MRLDPWEDLEERLQKTIKSLNDLSIEATIGAKNVYDLANVARLQGKRDGVSLALSYLRDYR